MGSDNTFGEENFNPDMEDNLSIKAHIKRREFEKAELLTLWKKIEELHADVGLKAETFRELQAKISSKVAQCEISIRDHKRLL